MERQGHEITRSSRTQFLSPVCPYSLVAATLLCCLVLSPASAQVWDVDRLIRARNPGASFTTTERVSTTWQTLRSITYNPELSAGAVGSATVEEASLVRRSAKNIFGLLDTDGQCGGLRSNCLIA